MVHQDNLVYFMQTFADFDLAHDKFSVSGSVRRNQIFYGTSDGNNVRIAEKPLLFQVLFLGFAKAKINTVDNKGFASVTHVINLI